RRTDRRRRFAAFMRPLSRESQDGPPLSHDSKERGDTTIHPPQTAGRGLDEVQEGLAGTRRSHLRPFRKTTNRDGTYLRLPPQLSALCLRRGAARQGPARSLAPALLARRVAG